MNPASFPILEKAGNDAGFMAMTQFFQPSYGRLSVAVVENWDEDSTTYQFNTSSTFIDCKDAPNDILPTSQDCDQPKFENIPAELRPRADHRMAPTLASAALAHLNEKLGGKEAK